MRTYYFTQRFEVRTLPIPSSSYLTDISDILVNLANFMVTSLHRSLEGSILLDKICLSLESGTIMR
jgi:hypothetical protein